MLIVETLIDSNLDNRQRQVIKDRYLLRGKKRTLAEIGKELSLSRERVRQLEIESKNKLVAVLKTKSPNILAQFLESVKKSGGIITVKELLSTRDYPQILNLLAGICPDLRPLRNDQHLESGWILREINIGSVKALVDAITIKLKNNKDPIALKRLKALICVNPYYSESLFEAVIRSARNLVITDDQLVGLKNDRRIDPKTVGDKAYFILNKSGKPLHFSEIAKKVSLLNGGRTANKLTIHNELIASGDFVLVGRGIYALKKWGYVEGTIAEVIMDFLKRQESSQTLESILRHVNKERMVKRNTVIVNLAKNKTIAKTEAGEYYIK